MNKGIYFNKIMTPELYKNAKDQFALNKNILGNIFTDIETNVGRCLIKGLNNAQIGKIVIRSAATIPKIKSRIKNKIGTDSDFVMARYFFLHKLILPSEL
jgi:DNA-binding NarL/FixJ family response regulator